MSVLLFMAAALVTLEKSAKAAVADVNKVIAKNIEKAAVDAIHATASSIKVQVSA